MGEDGRCLSVDTPEKPGKEADEKLARLKSWLGRHMRTTRLTDAHIVGRADRTIDPQTIVDHWDRMGQILPVSLNSCPPVTWPGANRRRPRVRHSRRRSLA